ncbi:response regulator [soil metagenome]
MPGLMAQAVHRHAWCDTPLGPLEQWSPTLRTLADLVTRSTQPMFLAWGPSRAWIYNDAFIPIAGSKHPTCLGQAAEQVWAEAWSDLGPLFDRVFEGESIHQSGFTIGLHRHGRIEDASFDFSYTPVVAENGEVVALFGVCSETTERLEAHRAQLVWAERERTRIFELSRDLFAVATFEGQLQSINPAWSRQLGRSERELLDHSFATFIHPDDLANTAAVIEQLKAGRPVHQFYVRLLNAEGTPISFAWSAVPETEPSNGRFYTVGRDITEERAAAQELLAAQEALRQSQKMEAVGQLTGGIAHDFNNLLAGIVNNLQLMHRRLQSGRLENLERYVEVAQAAARRAASLTQRLLAFSRRQTLDARPTGLNRLVAGMAELISRSVGPGVTVELALADDLWLTKVDAPQLENALLNLVLNARDAMPQGGTISIETGNRVLTGARTTDLELPAGKYVVLQVRDTGVGMSAEVMGRAFDPFFTTKPLGEGTGLGLSMVHGFAHQSGGMARIWSEPGVGSTVSIHLPHLEGALETDESAATAQSGSAAPGAGVVLVIEDEAPIRDTLVEVLGEAGYQVLSAADASSGLSILHGPQRIDVLVSDIGLPGGMNGRQIADAARAAARPSLPVLFITGYAATKAVRDGELADGMELMTKPFDLDAFVQKVGELMRLTR